MLNPFEGGSGTLSEVYVFEVEKGFGDEAGGDLSWFESKLPFESIPTPKSNPTSMDIQSPVMKTKKENQTTNNKSFL